MCRHCRAYSAHSDEQRSRCFCVSYHSPRSLSCVCPHARPLSFRPSSSVALRNNGQHFYPIKLLLLWDFDLISYYHYPGLLRPARHCPEQGRPAAPHRARAREGKAPDPSGWGIYFVGSARDLGHIDCFGFRYPLKSRNALCRTTPSHLCDDRRLLSIPVSHFDAPSGFGSLLQGC